MSGLGSFFNNHSSALTANNVAAAATALIALLVEVRPFLDLHPATGDEDPEVDANAYNGRGGRGN
jgi:hypothetical protein